MFLQDFYRQDDNAVVRITADQASHFAKDVAGDFNPLHDADSKRFCVPGDLLFSLVLEKYGLSENMLFEFVGMVGDGVGLHFPDTDSDVFEVTDDNGKAYLRVTRSGKVNHDKTLIESFIRDYVAFSGHNFPYGLVPLLEQEQVMFNLDRPLVIYESMTIEFKTVDFSQPKLEALTPEFSVNGKRGSAKLHFQIKSGDDVVGLGFKKLAVSGLRAMDKPALDQFVENYLARKENYLQSA
ncbi:DUF3581 domain-containing protein [methane-oxidizing endosymbiont of Gigantopelta aegis]|uniref:DUF3581 domain-containing protein n=1 Tax=methane-oxidizing endosymbiont of Gigantopelta aegis TaxID=2794938 RepID=UPI0018DB1846|nr:DUF3581 domain-containing protein [methane-oxidizing endosymbiont of Gigantopelta aegis]